jgi:signal peptidase I
MRGTGAEELEKIRHFLGAVGGEIFPPRRLVENAEVLLLSAIVAIAVRTFFLQLFTIPTNSMWPTYRGQVAVPSTPGDEGKGDFLRGIRHHRILSPRAGTVYIPINDGQRARQQHSLLPFRPVRRWGIFPAHRYEIFIDGHPVPIDVPAEFDLEQLLVRNFFPNSQSGRLLDVLQNHAPERRAERYFLRTDCQVSSGDVLLDFGLVHGDVLFVERLTPHFLPPRRGEAIVWNSRRVPALAGDDRYYIKRAVARGGDDVSLLNGELWVGDRVANFSPPMEYNNSHRGAYSGYYPYGILESATVHVPPQHLFVLGDNSPNSYDSRFFGPIPQKAAIGRPCFRIYPIRTDQQPAQSQLH